MRQEGRKEGEVEEREGHVFYSESCQLLSLRNIGSKQMKRNKEIWWNDIDKMKRNKETNYVYSVCITVILLISSSSSGNNKPITRIRSFQVFQK